VLVYSTEGETRYAIPLGTDPVISSNGS
jgi:hypothetical protein